VWYEAPAEEPWVRLGQLAAAYYFAHFLIILPIISKIEQPLPLPNSITESVLGGKNKLSGGAKDPVGALAGNAA
jgi:ubiquinol-cytochrome c reductase cytochrome b subunit